jgi:hypothetical protein
MGVKGYMNGQLSIQLPVLRIVFVMRLSPSTHIHKLDGMAIIAKGERIGLFIDTVFVTQFDDGKQAGLKSWTRLVHAWKVDKKEREDIFNFLFLIFLF